ncbi:protein-tyrosine phosphatase-like protein [Halteromyces radiatus]|uniref:protein-tyrosine phosphatase-like protein n=1 Tax=Halteromyces radiatus TaxID=101107 RepID=UPI00221F6FC4|nr:protein-tyrosine phosphatase-like protein [Halteromyces radiatus]KAI8096809.1 protein-tyrosine phosphatase-like protein [Halteromyces radiatus]
MTANERISIINNKGENIVGILEKKPELDAGRKQPRLMLISHGVLGHKDYLFFRLLAQELPVSSFRFDFRGNGDSEGQAGYANMAEDADDIDTVASYFRKEGYEIFGVIGHSRGAVACLKYTSNCETAIPHVINLSGRYKMNDNQIYKNRPEIGAALDKDGYFNWEVKQRDRIVQIQVTKEDVDKFCSWDNSYVKNMPLSTCVLTVHGINDNIVPVYNAAMYANAIPNHTLVLLPDADHNFKGHFEEVVKTIVDHLNDHENDAYKKMDTMNYPSAVLIPRWIDVEGVKNFRDVGGWPLKDGTGYVRERTVFRCAHLGQITPKGVNVLHQLHVKAIFDFRAEPEIERYGEFPGADGITVYPSSMYSKEDFEPEKMAASFQDYFDGPPGFARSYMQVLSVAKQQYGKIFHYMIKELSRDSRNSLIVHCTAGKDRTGLWCVLLLGLCGVDEEVIAREYALTNLGYWVEDKEIEFRAKYTNTTFEQMKTACSAPYEAMKIFLVSVKEKYGSFESYIQNECGLTADECSTLRQLMVIPIPFEQKQLYRKKVDST